jgi:DNA gyrase/topoisomerase IV subunit B
MLAKHYKVNKRLIEIILHEFAEIVIPDANYDNENAIKYLISKVDIQHLMSVIGEEFNELVYDDKDQIIKGSIDSKFQSMELSERLVRKSINIILMIRSYNLLTRAVMLKHIKTGAEHVLSLMGVLEILRKYQPSIMHRFKGLGENNDDDIKVTIMDPNTRSLIKVTINDLQNDIKVFNTLRGSSPQDALARKMMMKEYQIPRDLLDT